MRRRDFPILKRHPKLAYLDSANTTLKPRAVIDAVREYYEEYSANIGRAAYEWSERATAEYEEARRQVAGLIGAGSDEVVFTHSATYGINQIAQGMRARLKRGDVILLTMFEHNSNLLVWQKLAEETGAEVRFVEEPVAVERVKIFSYTLASNVTGELMDFGEIVRDLKQRGALVAVDATQVVSRMRVDVGELGCDFLVCSSHKLYGPSGVGVLYMKRELQEEMAPLVYGSQTFGEVSRAGFRLLAGPARFEPGTPNIEGAIGLGAAVRFVRAIGLEKLWEHDQKLVQVYREEMSKNGLEPYMVGRPERQIGVCSLAHPRAHPHDVAMLLDAEQIAVRAGRACADVLLQTMGLGRGVVRASFGMYTTAEEVRRFVRAYRRAVRRLDG
jgi:cysteine desulfurase/selenocysteine lyase